MPNGKNFPFKQQRFPASNPGVKHGNIPRQLMTLGVSFSHWFPNLTASFGIGARELLFVPVGRCRVAANMAVNMAEY
jgi:hypothetical protein